MRPAPLWTNTAEHLAAGLLDRVRSEVVDLHPSASIREVFACALITLAQQAKRRGLQDDEVVDFVLRALVVEAIEGGLSLAALQDEVATQIDTAWRAAEREPAPAAAGRA